MAEDMKEKIYEISFQIISTVGTAGSKYMEAVSTAKEGNFEDAAKILAEGDELYAQGHSAHADLIQKEAAGEELPFYLMLMHAEDQMMKTELLKKMAEELIEVYQRLEER